MEEKEHCFQETSSDSIPLFANYDLHHLPVVIEENEEIDNRSIPEPSLDNGLPFIPRVTFKMSLSSESIDKCIPPKSPFRSALKQGTNFSSQGEDLFIRGIYRMFSEVIGLKRVNKNEIDDLQKQLTYEKWLSKKHSHLNLPNHV